jgi:predicted NUDIX family NTP pyrophosphohydrolase
MKTSAGLLMYRRMGDEIQVLIVHPGGPFFAKRPQGCWSIPKGLVDGEEDLLAAARREFGEETGLQARGDFLPLGSIKQKGGKAVHAWALAGNCDPEKVKSNTFRMEWPPRSGQEQEFPEVDEARFVTLEEARRLLLPAQLPFLDRLEEILG